MSDGNEYIFTNSNYMHNMIEYSGTFNDAVVSDKGVYITPINKEYAIISIALPILIESNATTYSQDINYIRTIVDKYIGAIEFKIIAVIQPQLFTLQEISAVESAEVYLLQSNEKLGLNGQGVIVGIIDTGIDYLSEEFRDKNGKSRIISIWDQTIGSNITVDKRIPFGTIYSNEEINKAIEAYESGKDPYAIVPSKDTNGHGTAMAGIVGAQGKNKDIKGIAPECQFVIIKLSEAEYVKRTIGTDVPVFSLGFIFAAMEYLRDILLLQQQPIVILLPLGSSNGNHKGDNLFDNFVENISSNIGIVIVTGAGNEGDKDGHVSGVIRDSNKIEVIELLIDENQNYIGLELWVELPNIVDINLVSPSGEETGFIQGAANANRPNDFIFEKTKSKITYFLPEEYTGEELISIYFADISPGMWQIKLRLRSGQMAKYNAWIWQQGLAKKGSRFLPSDPYGTITIPGDSNFIVTVAAYNQNNNNLLSYSGVGFREQYPQKIDFAAGGVNTPTVGLNNSVRIINGTSLSAAIGAGACALLFQWGIVQKNYPYMYSQSIKTFLRRGVTRRAKDVYPNPEWGYGAINFYKIFENMM